MASDLREVKDETAADDYHEFLAILQEHDRCDVILVCSPSPTSQTQLVERFYCQRQQLSKRCQLFASMQSFEACGSVARTAEIVIPASGDIVFEVLRYAYVGVLLYPPVFHKRFGELLVTIDFLGMCYDAQLSLDYMFQHSLWEKSPTSPRSIFDSLSLHDLLASMTDDMLRQAFRGKLLERNSHSSSETDSGFRCVGFATRQALLAKVAELKLRASGGPPPSDPFVIFDNFLKKTSGSLQETSADESEEWTWIVEDPRPRPRKHSI
eukprot:TRINITY_DN7758_c0_g2_i1.p1 TRINITY_DN7758_c0_g2~~TRINITY_DN7758_c0_g2_i1.p1  ORF type:complete len:267 (+),score=37.18 TRINITY_DN7758_c0_g2_i1:56-856(+)